MSGLTTQTDCGQSGDGTLDEATRHRLLACERRRIALELIADRQNPLALDELAAAVAAAQADAETKDRSDRRRTRIALHHVDLPLLAAAGVCEYDRDAHSVEPDPSVLDRLVGD